MYRELNDLALILFIYSQSDIARFVVDPESNYDLVGISFEEL